MVSDRGVTWWASERKPEGYPKVPGGGVWREHGHADGGPPRALLLALSVFLRNGQTPLWL